MVLPKRHVGELEDINDHESAEMWNAMTNAVRAIKQAYHPEGLNLGTNLGRAAGAGVLGHFHTHVMPRWSGDANFMTSVAETRVLSESLDATYEKLSDVWPKGPAN